MIAALCVFSCARREPPHPIEASPPHSSVRAEAARTGEGIVVPGTGVTMKLPPGVTLAPVGTMMSDPKWEVSVSVVTARATSSLAPVLTKLWRTQHPGEMQTVTIGEHSGTLSRHPREGSDESEGRWSLLVMAEEVQLDIELRDRRNDPSAFEALRQFLSSVKWDPSKVDAEQSFGATPGAIEGMTLEKTSAGQLLYRPTGKPGSGVELVLTGGSLPTLGQLDVALCREKLRATAEQSLARPAAFEAIAPDASTSPAALTVGDPVSIPGLIGCELDARGRDGRRHYMAFLQFGSPGVFVLVNGEAPSASYDEWRPRFRGAALHLRSLRGAP